MVMLATGRLMFFVIVMGAVSEYKIHKSESESTPTPVPIFDRTLGTLNFEIENRQILFD